jgi:hypothetical protein
MLIEVAGLAMLAVSSPTAPLAVLMVVSCVSLVWPPVLAFLAAPEPSTRRPPAFNGWLRRDAG